MPSEKYKSLKGHRSDQQAPENRLHETATLTLQRLLDPVIEVMLDTGISVRELNALVRSRAVSKAAARLPSAPRSSGASKSRIAISTGLSRAEVARMLQDGHKPEPSVSSAKSRPADRVMFAWHHDPLYSTAPGKPDRLPAYGKRRSFESLARRYVAGVPVRAMIDHLQDIGSVRLLPDQSIEVIVRRNHNSRFSIKALAALGERGQSLMTKLYLEALSPNSQTPSIKKRKNLIRSSRNPSKFT